MAANWDAPPTPEELGEAPARSGPDPVLSGGGTDESLERQYAFEQNPRNQGKTFVPGRIGATGPAPSMGLDSPVGVPPESAGSTDGFRPEDWQRINEYRAAQGQADWSAPPTQEELDRGAAPNSAAIHFVAANAEHPPDEKTAEAIRYSKITGMPQELVAADLDSIKQKVDAALTNYRGLAERNPAITKYLAENPHTIPMVQKDVKNLSVIEWAMTRPWAAFMDGLHEQQAALAQFFRAEGYGYNEDARNLGIPLIGRLGGPGNIKPLDPLIQQGLEKAEEGKRQFGEDYGANNPVTHAVIATAQLTPFLGLNAASGPFVVPFNYAEGVGQASWALDNYRDANGNKIDPVVANAAAQSAGIASGIIFGKGLSLLGKAGIAEKLGVGKLGSKVGADTLMNWLADQAVVGTAAKFLGRFGLHALTGAMTLMANTAATQGAEAIAKGASSLSSKDPFLVSSAPLYAAMSDGLSNVARATWESGKQALRDLWMISLFGPSKDAVVDHLKKVGEQRLATESIARFDAQVQGATKSTLLDKSPEAFHELVTKMAPGDMMYFPAKRWAEYFQGQKLDPAHAAETVGVKTEDYNAAVTSDGDIAVKSADALTQLAKDGHLERLRDDVRLKDPKLPTGREMKEEARAEASELVEAAKRREDEIRDAKQRIEDYVQEQAKAGGVRPADVREGTEMLKAATEATALRLNVSMREAARQVGVGNVSVTGESGFTQAHADSMRRFHEWLLPADTEQGTAKLATISPENRVRMGYWDINARVPNAKHFQDLADRQAAETFGDDAKDLGFGHASIEGMAFVNNNRDHGQGNLLYRAGAKALHEAAPESFVSKTGGDFELRPKDAAHMADIVKRANELMPPELKGFAITGAFGESRKAAKKAHIDMKKAAEDAGTRAKRKEKPLGFQGDIKALKFPEAGAQAEVDPELAKAAANMSPAEFFDKFAVTKGGLLNNLGWHLLDHGPDYHYMALDIKDLTKWNTEFGDEGGDTLIDGIEKIIAHYGGSSFSAAHLHGDEFALRSRDSAALVKFHEMLKEKLQDRFIVEEPTRGEGALDIDLWHGIAKGSYEAADRELSRKKLEAQAAAPGEAERPGAGVEAEGVQNRERRDLEFRGPGAESRGAALQGHGGLEEGRLSELHQVELNPFRHMPDARAWVARMRSKERQKAASEFLDFLVDKRPTRPTGVPKDIEDHLANEWGLVDPANASQFGAQGLSKRGDYRGPTKSGGIENMPEDFKRQYFDEIEHRTGKKFKQEQVISHIEGRPVTFNQPAWHGTPHDFENFSLHKIGSGEGAQSYGWGLYFAGKKEVAEYYKRALEDVDVSMRGQRQMDLAPGSPEMEAFKTLEYSARSRSSRGPEGVLEYAQAKAQSIKLALEDDIDRLEKDREVNDLTPLASEKDIQELRDHLPVLQAAADYLKGLSPSDVKMKSGKLFHVDVPDDKELLDYDKRMLEQPRAVKEAVSRLVERLPSMGWEFGKHKAADGSEWWAWKKPDAEGLLTAIGESKDEDLARGVIDTKMTGETLYEQLAEGLGGPRQASELLRSLGMPGLKYLDQGSRVTGHGTSNYVVWDDGRVKILNKFDQDPNEPGGGPRGSIRMDVSGAGARVFDIRMLAADKSTFAHEVAHFLSWSLHDLEHSDLATDQIRKDYDTLLKFAGYENAEDRVKATADRTNEAKEEKISHGFELYLSEGKAPSKGLARVFNNFKKWMLDIYKGATGSAGIQEQYQRLYGQPLEISDDVRGVFDRLLAMEDAKKAANKAMGGLEPDVEAMKNMTPEEAAKYRQRIEDAAVAQDQETAKGGPERAERLRAQREEFQKQTEKELDAQPVYRAWRYLQHGDTVDGEALVDENGKPYKLLRSDIEKNYPGAAERLPPGSTRTRNGVTAEALAPLLGFNSGDDLINALANATPRDQAIEQGTQDKMDAAHGPELERMQDAALSGAHTQESLGALVQALRDFVKEVKPTFSRRVNAVDPEAIRRSADLATARKMVAELNPNKYANAEKKAAKDAAYLDGKGEKEASYDKRQQRLVAHVQFMSERDAKQELAQAKDKMENPSDRIRGELGKADPAYRDAHDQVLAAVGLAPGRSDATKTLDDALQLADREGAEVGDHWIDTVRGLVAKPKPWKELTVSQARDVVDAVQALRHAADESLNITLLGRKVELNELRAQIAERTSKVQPAIPRPAYGGKKSSLWERANMKRRGLSAAFQDIETIAEMMDGGTSGPVHDVLIKSRLEARDHEVELIKEVLKPLREAFEKIPKDILRLRDQAVDVAHLLPTPQGREAGYTRSFLWSLRLNLGNEGNLQRLIDGNKWTLSDMEQAVSKLSEPELDFLQKVQDVADSLFPKLAAAYEARTGLKLGKVEARALNINGKDYRGGYWPIRYDKDAEGVQGQMQEINDIKDLLPTKLQPTVTNSATKARLQKALAPLDLTWNTVPQHFATVIHDIAYGDWVRQTAKLLVKPRVPNPTIPSFDKTAVDYLGPERAKEFLPWLRDLSLQRQDSAAGHVSDAIKGMGFLRTRLAAATIMLNMPSTARHMVDPWTTMADSEAVLPHYIAGAYLKVMNPASWGNTPEFKLSRELEYRRAAHDDNLRGELRKMGEVPTWMQKATEVGFLTHKWTDMFTTRVGFKAAYDQAIANGATVDQAVERADDVVRRSFPSSDIAEKPPILRTRQGWAAAVTFYGYASKMHNLRSRSFDRIARSWNAGERSTIASEAAKMIALGLVASAGAYLAARGPTQQEDDEKGLAKSRAEWLSTEVALSPLDDAPPIIGPAIKAALLGHKVNIASTPELMLLDHQLERFGNMLHGKKSEDDEAAVARLAATLVGGLAGGAGQLQRTVPYLIDTKSGKERPRGPFDFGAGFFFGDKKTRGANPLTDIQNAISR